MSQSDDPGQPQNPSDQPLGDQIRSKLDEYEVERHLTEIAATVEHAVRQGVSKAGELVHDHRDDIGGWIDKAGGAVDRRTEGRHAERINQVRGSLERGVEKIADQRHAGPAETTDEGPDGSAPGHG